MSNRFRFEAETRLIRWGESSSAGRTITLELPPDAGDAHPFKGFPTGHSHGQRFRMQFDAIDDAEQPIPSAGNSTTPPQPINRKDVTAAAEPDGTRSPTAPPAEGIPKDRRPWETLSPQVQAGILCSDGGFQKYVRELTGWTADEHSAAVWLRQELGILSRKELEGRPDLAAKLDEIREEFMLWAGRVPVAVR